MYQILLKMHPRIMMDIKKLQRSGVKIDFIDSTNTSFTFILNGPKESLYETGKWRIQVTLPSEYPFKSPSVGFIDRILHPNVDYCSGTICLAYIPQLFFP